jgi:hypothetical protein
MLQFLAIQDFIPSKDLPSLPEPWNTIAWVFTGILATVGTFYTGFLCGRTSAFSALNNVPMKATGEGTKDVTGHLPEP